MIPRGLAIAVAVGAASAVVFGIAIEMYGGDAQNVRTDGPAVSVTVVDDEYSAGEEVRVRLINSGSTALEFAEGTHYGIRITQLDGILVYASESADASSLGPGQGADFAWGQTKADGEQIHAGVYRITTEAVSPDGERVRDAATVQIR